MIYTDLISMLRDMKKHYKSLRKPVMLSADNLNALTIGFVIFNEYSVGFENSKEFELSIRYGLQIKNLIFKDFLLEENNFEMLEKEIKELFLMNKNNSGRRNIYDFIIDNKTENYQQLNLIISRLEKLEIFE
jgi:hypothetical protein